MSKFLTVGMPCFDDYHGVFFSIQALRMYHAEVIDQIEILIIDNNPTSGHGELCKKLADDTEGVSYYAEDKWKSTCVKDRVFSQAETPFALCMDCHILFPLGAMARLIDFFKENPETTDFYQGPLLLDDLKGIQTHFKPVWSNQMYGQWSVDERGKDVDGEPFEIQMQGMGVFTCKTDAWVGFNPLFRGFGCEEGYIHQKFRNRGDKCWCLPFLRWNHRFNRPDRREMTIEEKIRNYYLAWNEIGWETASIKEHFRRWVTPATIDEIHTKVLKELSMQQMRNGQLPMGTP